MKEEERERSRHICRDFGDFSPGENTGEGGRRFGPHGQGGVRGVTDMCGDYHGGQACRVRRPFVAHLFCSFVS